MPRLPTDNRRFLKDLAVILGLPAVILGSLLVWWAPWHGVIPEPWDAPPATNVFETLRGTWGWTGDSPSSCALDPHQITFSADYTTMSIASSEPWTDSSGVEHAEAVYDILEVESNRIRGVIRGEGRRTITGEPVVWDLVLMDTNTYRWHQTDWSAGQYTAAIERCGRPPEITITDREDPVVSAPAVRAARPVPAQADVPCPAGAKAEDILDETIVYPTIGTDTVFPKDSLRIQPYWTGSVSYTAADRPEEAPHSGRAIVRFAVNPDGLVPACLVTVVAATDSYVAREARSMLSNVQYVPGQREGRKVWVRIQDTVNFRPGPP